MLFEFPGFNFSNTNFFNFNLNGNSIFFMTPTFFAIFFTVPIRIIRKKIKINPYLFSIWTTLLIVMIPSLMHYGSGWIQLGYRFSLDINVLLMILVVFGFKGQVSKLFLLGTIFSIAIYLLGIHALM
jgi:hypothetical protein